MDTTLMINPIWIIREGWCVHWPHWPYMYSFIQASTTVPALTMLCSPDMAVTCAPSTQSCRTNSQVFSHHLWVEWQPAHHLPEASAPGCPGPGTPRWERGQRFPLSHWAWAESRPLPLCYICSVWVTNQFEKNMYLKQWNFCNQALTWVKRVGLVLAV